MRRKVIGLGVLLVLIAAGGLYAWSAHLSPTARAKAVVKSGLYDPNSAVFERVVHVPGAGVTCGFVNGKNRYGAYVGATAFIVEPSGLVIFSPGGDTGVGSLEGRIEAVKEEIEFLERLAICNEH